MARIRDEIVMPQMAPAAEAAGYTVLGVWENGFRHITNNVRPIETPEDLQGVKLRVPGGEWRVRMFEAYGANPSPLALSEVFVALQTGVMDGQENPYAQIYPSRFYEVQEYLSNTGHVYTPAYLVAGRSWAGMDPEVQTILQETAVEMQDRVYEIAAELEADLLGQLTEAGMAVNEVDREAFVAASAPIYEEFGAEVEGGADLVEQARALAEE
jgi:TRAP-type C4-dicarboxylate transport system substrate-binding protein